MYSGNILKIIIFAPYIAVLRKSCIFYSIFYVSRPQYGRCIQRPYKVLVMAMWFINLKSAVIYLVLCKYVSAHCHMSMVLRLISNPQSDMKNVKMSKFQKTICHIKSTHLIANIQGKYPYRHSSEKLPTSGGRKRQTRFFNNNKK